MVEENLTIAELPQDWYKPQPNSKKLKSVLKDLYDKIYILDERLKKLEPKEVP